MERLQVKAKDLLKAKFWTQAAHQGLRKNLLANMSGQGTMSTDAAQDNPNPNHGVEVVVNNKMRAGRYCKDKRGIVSAAHVVYIELEPKEPMDKILVVQRGKLVGDGTPCIVYGRNARKHLCRRGSLYLQRGRRLGLRCTVQGKRTWFRGLAGL